MTRADLILMKDQVSEKIELVFRCGLDGKISVGETLANLQCYNVIHEMCCRELATGKPIQRVQRLTEAMQIARIHLERYIGEDSSPPLDIHMAHLLLVNSLQKGGRMSNHFDPSKPRKKIHWLHGRRSMKTVRAFQAAAAIGALVAYQGQTYRTESHPGLNAEGDACVFLAGVETPVPLYLLELLEEPAHA